MFFNVANSDKHFSLWCGAVSPKPQVFVIYSFRLSDAESVEQSTIFFVGHFQRPYAFSISPRDSRQAILFVTVGDRQMLNLFTSLYLELISNSGNFAVFKSHPKHSVLSCKFDKRLQTSDCDEFDFSVGNIFSNSS